MAGQRGAGLLLPLLLLSLDVLDLALETTTLLPTNDSTITATIPPFSSETFTPEVLMDASAATPRGRSPSASITPTPQARGSPAHSTSGSPANTTVEPKLTPTGLGLTTGTPAPNLMATTTNCAAETTIVTSVGTSTALSLSSSGVETSPLTAPTSAFTPPPSVGTTLGTSTSPGPGSASSPTAAAPTAASDEPSATRPSTVTNTEVPGTIPASSQPAETSPGAATSAAPETTAEASALLPTTDSTTTAIVPSSRPGTGAPNLKTSSTSIGNDNTSPPTPPSTTPALTAASAEPLTTPSDTTEDPNTSMTLPRSSPTSGQTAGTMAKTTPAISTPTLGTTLGTVTEPATLSAATGTEPSSPAINSTQTTEFTLSNPTDLPVTLPVCPTITSNTSASHLFLSLRINVPLDLGNTTVQELVLSKLRQDLQTAFPCAGLTVEWRGQRRT